MGKKFSSLPSVVGEGVTGACVGGEGKGDLRLAGPGGDWIGGEGAGKAGGNPLAVKVISEGNVFAPLGVTVKVKDAEPPGRTEPDGSEKLMEKSSTTSPTVELEATRKFVSPP